MQKIILFLLLRRCCCRLLLLLFSFLIWFFFLIRFEKRPKYEGKTWFLIPFDVERFVNEPMKTITNDKIINEQNEKKIEFFKV